MLYGAKHLITVRFYEILLDFANVVKGEAGVVRYTTMNNKDLLLNSVSNRHPLEDLRNVLEHEEVVRVLLQQFLVKTVFDVDNGRLVVAAIDVNAFGERELVSEQQHEAFNRLFPLVHHVSVEKVHVFG